MLLIVTAFFLLSCVGCFTVTKYRRVQDEKKKFAHIHKMLDKVDPAEKRRFLASRMADAQFIAGDPNA